MFKCRLNHCFRLVLLLLFSVSYNSTCIGQTNEFIRDGGFELGIVDVDIVRSPRYISEATSELNPPVRDTNKPLAGNYSLRLPGLKTGGYRLVYRAVPLVTGERYQLSLDLRVEGNSAAVRLEVFSSMKRAGEKKIKLKSGDHHLILNFNTATKPQISSNEAPFFVRIWVNNKNPVWLDNVSLRGPSGSSSPPDALRAWLEPDMNLSVYPVNGEGNFILRALACDACQFSYRITDPISDMVMVAGNLTATQQDDVFTAKIPLIMSKRGFYWVTVKVSDQQKNELADIKHSYVVINPNPAQVAGAASFGVAMEEQGKITQIDAFTRPDEYYKLAQQIGVGSVRIFSLLMPDIISNDGIRFDFSEADAAFSLMEKYNIEPMVVLGSNNIYRIARWLRSSIPGKNSIDLKKGLRTSADKRLYKRTQDYGQYLDLDKYKLYLEAVFAYFKGRVKHYELWNEPGHKFQTKDFIRIAELTRSVQQRIIPGSSIIGYSSTRRGQVGAGEAPDSLPKFLHEVQTEGGIHKIDILSYHSEHAFPFMHKKPNHNDHETGYVPILRTLLKHAHKADMPIWDTERGIPWKSPHEERLDYKAGIKLWKHTRPSEDVLDSARQLPMVYSTAFANAVERLFWFYLESSSGTIQRANRRWGFFDAQREPMPHVPIYDAMTEILQGASFEKLIESNNGGRAYIFSKLDGLVVLAYNWQEKKSSLLIQQQSKDEIKILDIMGNLSKQPKIKNKSVEIIMDEWPQYILLSSKDHTKIKFSNHIYPLDM